MKKIFLTLVLLLAFAVTANAQNKRITAKASEKTTQLNAEIVSQDEDLALSTEQTEQITALYAKRLMEVKALKKQGAEKAEIKAVNKKYNQQIYKEVLSKKQLKARRAGKKEDKDNDDND